MDGIGRLLIGIGVMIFLLGGLFLLLSKVPGLGWLGRLPGDIHIQRGGFSFFFPLTTCIVLSVMLTIIWQLLRR
ncbi:MAG TPA: DUF2905 domain-containing protein [Firmicutes bacterium]|nr:DUF2905 domain-containing protein [Bacillota bacterium]